jgi:NADPH:quinone reductase
MAPDPVPGPHEALVEVRAIALNFGEVAFLAEQRKPGPVIGWECAGVVVEAAADGSGPPAGARVAGFGPAGGWAERRAMNVDEIAVVPKAIDLGAAAVVPVAGVTAPKAVRALGGDRPARSRDGRERRRRKDGGAARSARRVHT